MTLVSIIIVVFVLFALLYAVAASKLNLHISCPHPTNTTFAKIPRLDYSLQDRPIVIFFHVCNIGPLWKDVIHEQMHTLIASGLYAAARDIFVGCSCSRCEEEIPLVMKKYSKVIMMQSAHSVQVHENHTINSLLAYCKELDQDPCNILYLHTKGITGKSPNQLYWRRFMMVYMVELWQLCHAILSYGYSTVGVNKSNLFFLQSSFMHYSGNFWWARSEYLSSLDFIPADKMHDRFQAEWKLLQKAKAGENVNIGNEVWWSVYVGPLAIGLYSKSDIDFSDLHQVHLDHMQNPWSIPLAIF
jgi:hypothetical protein